MFSKLFIALTLAAAASASCVHGTSLHRREAGTVAVSNFGYSGERGPLNWAGLDAANVACRNSKVQSPIVLDDSIARAASAPQMSIASVAEAEFENLGTTLETVVNGTTVFEGATFALKQFHLHTPSEHRINEEYFPLEMHMVHEGTDGSIAVIAIPFQLTEDGSTTALLTSVITNIAQVTTPGTATTTGPLDFTELIAAVTAGPLFQYTGSLTTPPCAEGLTFLVLEKPLPLNVRTFNTLKSVIKFNARYSQNTLGQTNLLDVAVALAVREDGLAVAGGAASSASSNTNTTCSTSTSNSSQNQVHITSDVDVQALVRELVSTGGEIRLETVTTSTTKVVPVSGGGGIKAQTHDSGSNSKSNSNSNGNSNSKSSSNSGHDMNSNSQSNGNMNSNSAAAASTGTGSEYIAVKITRDEPVPARRRRGLNFSSWANAKDRRSRGAWAKDRRRL